LFVSTKLSTILLLVLGIWLHVEVHKYMDMELSPDFSATAPYVLVGTGLLFLETLACCCTIKEQPILLYIVSCF
jgi:hypothetical protein